MWKLAEDIFTKYFSSYDKRIDIGKTPQNGNRGVVQRYNELLADDYDVELAPLLDNLVTNTLDPETAFENYLPYLENILGLGFVVSPDPVVRRKAIKRATLIHQKKGTKTGYKIAFGLIGYTIIDLFEYNELFGFDNPNLTLDHPQRTFDRKCYGCTDYDIILEGDEIPSQQVINVMIKLIELVEPINARWRKIIVNDVDILELCADGSLVTYIDCDYFEADYIE